MTTNQTAAQRRAILAQAHSKWEMAQLKASPFYPRVVAMQDLQQSLRQALTINENDIITKVSMENGDVIIHVDCGSHQEVLSIDANGNVLRGAE